MSFGFLTGIVVTKEDVAHSFNTASVCMTAEYRACISYRDGGSRGTQDDPVARAPVNQGADPEGGNAMSTPQGDRYEP